MSDADCHSVATARPPPEEGAVTVALVGRPNSGKSALYNRITGGEAHVGNFPGITVDVLEGDVMLPGGRTARFVDLPGVYSLAAAFDPATDEGVTREFLGSERRVDLVVQVVDASRLALGLLLTQELLARPELLLVAVTQSDVLAAEGRTLDRETLAEALGAPVVVVSALLPASRETLLAAVADTLERAAPRTPASRPLDPDALASRVLLDRPDATPEAIAHRARTDRLDRVLLHPVVGPLAFVSIMTAIFAAVFLVADPVSEAFGAFAGIVAARFGPLLGDGLLRSLVIDGVLGGAGTVLGFLPQVVVLGVAIEVMEATGYLARGAFLVDRFLRFAGLGGRSFVPLLMGHACAVPAIQATRILRNPRERLTTILVVPLMTCSARIPTYALLIAAFFPARGAFFQASVFVALYFAGIVAGVIAAAALRGTVVRGRGLPMVLEMPAYRLPQAMAVARGAARNARRFAIDVGRVIVASSIVLWALLHVPGPGHAEPGARPIEHSVAASVGHALEPVTRPLGYDWRINVGLIGAFGARELMVSTLGVIFGVEDAGDDPAPLAEHIRASKRSDGRPTYDLATGLSLLAFFVLACQCMSTLAVIRRETRSLAWPAFTLAYTYALAYAAALAVHFVASRFA